MAEARGVDQHEINMVGLNMLFWTSLRALALRDVKEACLRYNVSEAVVDEVLGMDERQIQSLASGFTVQFRPCVTGVPLVNRCAVDSMRRLAGAML